MAVTGSDDFNAYASGSTLAGQTAPVGGVWTAHASLPSALVITDAGRVRPGTGTTARLSYFPADPATAEYDVEFTTRYFSAVATNIGGAGRVDPSSNACYLARWGQAAGTWELFKILSGTATSLGSYTEALSAGTDYRGKLQIRDAAKKFFRWNGTSYDEVISSSDNAITAAGKAGIRTGNTVAGTNTSGQHLDDLVVTDLSGSTLVTGSDSGTGTGAGSLVAALTGSDSAAGTDSASLVVLLTGSDSGAALEGSSLVAALGGSDSGAAAEGSGLGGSTLVTGSDSAAGTDSASLVVSLGGSDSAAALEGSGLAVSLGGSESGAAAEGSIVVTIGPVDTGAGPSWFVIVAEGLDFSGPVLAEDLAGAEPSGLASGPVLAEDL